MAPFVGIYTNKIDKKGRVSVPASFRAVRLANGEGALYGYPAGDPTLGQRIIKCVGIAHMNALSQEIKNLDPASDRYEEIDIILSFARELSFDAEGRVILTEDFIELLECEDQVTFKGHGEDFYIYKTISQQPVQEMKAAVDKYLNATRKRKEAAKHD
ncbi:MAG: hypothetical protein QM537_00910 [Candidatus Symbiobacter sp.]|nr:hypothetical protein [Candidatus Symbiobacter sp.]